MCVSRPAPILLHLLGHHCFREEAEFQSRAHAMTQSCCNATPPKEHLFRLGFASSSCSKEPAASVPDLAFQRPEHPLHETYIVPRSKNNVWASPPLHTLASFRNALPFTRPTRFQQLSRWSACFTPPLLQPLCCCASLHCSRLK